jgi:hypothetical protein
MFEDDEQPRRSATLNFAMISAIGMTLICVAIGQGAAQFAELTSTTPAMTADAGAKSSKFNAIDYAATGAVKGQKIVINPCER